METIRVNMTPCEDIKTIHASQNDNEAREWGFELHNNGEKIDSSSISDQLVFKAYKGVTEEILPTNGSTPTTSPFKGDIKYPQGLLSDQEFLYRESPTEEDGLAFVENIKGNTLNWNQIYNVNSDRTNIGVNIKVVNGAVSITGTSTGTGSGPAFAWTDFQGVIGHKYIITKDFVLPSGDYIFDQYNFNSSTDLTTVVFTLNNSGSYIIPQLRVTQTGVTYNISGHLCVYDLTKMFGSGNEPTTVEEFTSFFPLPYYDYNQGTLLSFNGNGLKTVGKNQFKLNPSATSSNIINDINETTGAVDVADTTAIRWSTPYIGYTDVTAGQTYTASLKDGVTLIYGRIGGSTTTGQPSSSNQPNTSIGGAITSLITNITPSRTFVANETQRIYWYYCTDSGNANHQEFTFYPQIEHGSTVTDFEPYTSSTLSLPISTYFPNGMDGINDVKDEKNETGYIKRFVSITFDGSESWAKETFQGWSNTYYVNIGTHYIYYTDWNTDKIYCVCDRFQGVSYNQTKGANMVVMTGRGQYIEFLAPETITSVADWKTWLSNNPTTIKFELAIPLENYGVVDLGSLTWTAVSTDTSGVYRMRSNGLQGLVKNTSSTSEVANIICPLYVATGSSLNYRRTKGIAIETNGMLFVYDENYNTSSSPEIFKQAMSGVYLLYEKENPQGFTTATLVTENGEVALANENGVLVGKCNSDVSADAGFIEGKIKLSDEDGDVYSNKIQIHVERKPS